MEGDKGHLYSSFVCIRGDIKMSGPKTGWVWSLQCKVHVHYSAVDNWTWHARCIWLFNTSLQNYGALIICQNSLLSSGKWLPTRTSATSALERLLQHRCGVIRPRSHPPPPSQWCSVRSGPLKSFHTRPWRTWGPHTCTGALWRWNRSGSNIDLLATLRGRVVNNSTLRLLLVLKSAL